MSLKKLLATSTGSRSVPAKGTEFDGVTDYLSRSSDLTGNVDSKTFTFSAWVYNSLNTNTNNRIYSIGTTEPFFIQHGASANDLEIKAKNSAGTVILTTTTALDIITKDTFVHLLISIDLVNIANRAVYINDRLVSATWNTYTNDLIDFTQLNHDIANGTGGVPWKGRLSNLYLDYTYRELSIEANRRLFITADGKPADSAPLIALNPILYLPMNDASTAHINLGTGGNFVQNGTLDTASRGANQDNCVASYFDGVADYLSRTSLTGIADGKVFTFSCNIDTTLSALGTIFQIGESTTARFNVQLIYSAGLALLVQAYNASGTKILDFSTAYGSIITNRNYQITFSIDLANSSNRALKFNNILQSPTWTTYTNDIIDFATGTPKITIGATVATTPASYYIGNIGELYFNTVYTDLSTSNPFWEE